MRTSLTILSLFVAFITLSQKKVLNRELMVENDNDAYTLNLTRDQYYSNGVAVRYRILTDSNRWKDSFEKVIRSYHINHRIYSPKRIWWEDSADMDRPFAGQLSLAISNEYYFKKQSYLNIKFELGWMGPAIKTGKLQYRWHKAFGMSLPRGWKFQINDAPIINLYGTYSKTWLSFKNVDMTSESNVALGTSFTHARQELMFRFGTIRPIHKSTQYNGLVGTKKGKPGNHEFYFFISPGLEFVGYNATIEGNLIGKESIYTEESEHWVYQTRAGIMASWTKFDFGLVYYRRTKETPESTFHKYVGIRMNQRF
ncbi:MAG: lipid A deacylase LpxR family protein [Bacteroidota bacterium]